MLNKSRLQHTVCCRRDLLGINVLLCGAILRHLRRRAHVLPSRGPEVAGGCHHGATSRVITRILVAVELSSSSPEEHL